MVVRWPIVYLIHNANPIFHELSFGIFSTENKIEVISTSV